MRTDRGQCAARVGSRVGSEHGVWGASVHTGRQTPLSGDERRTAWNITAPGAKKEGVMMVEMTTRERFARMFEHREADRVPIVDIPWPATIERWRREGMPEDMDFVDFFDLDHVSGIHCDISPRYEAKVVEETPEYTISTTPWGVTLKNWRHAASTPEFLEHTVVDRDSWAEAQARMTPSRDRVDWAQLERDYPTWRERGDWIVGGLWFGFDVTHSWTVGTERLLMALKTDPEWCWDMFNHYLDVGLAMLDMVWDAGYTFDAVCWPDDIGFKHNQFFSLDTYREVLKPVQKRAVDWAHAREIKVNLHSCGDVNPFVPEFIEIGIDA
ncbi:MAG TPA: hypothetical protein ENN80_12205, partial [Candidatus Hydrogenedentes bacterium]|nr:hypothetical protein [Candidatus Hydrogenedentota bacterium]